MSYSHTNLISKKKEKKSGNSPLKYKEPFSFYYKIFILTQRKTLGA